MLAEIGSQLDPTRTHFLGKVPYDAYKKILQVSAAHVHLTYPFVLSWSMVEAMASECLIVGSATATVQELLSDGIDARITSIFDMREIRESTIACIEGSKAECKALGRAARQRARAYGKNLGSSCIERAALNCNRRH